MNEIDDLIAALRPVKVSFESLDIRYFVGGSVASSFHGATRSTMAVDLVAKMSPPHVTPLLAKISDEFYASELAIRDAIERKGCFNLIHHATSFKVDVFVCKGRPFDNASMTRSVKGEIGLTSKIVVPFATPEDTIISKLEWYRLGNEVSQRQWDDITRVMRILGAKIDADYLKATADEVGVADLMERLRNQMKQS